MDMLTLFTPEKMDTLLFAFLLAMGLFVVYLIWKYGIKNRGEE